MDDFSWAGAANIGIMLGGAIGAAILAVIGMCWRDRTGRENWITRKFHI